MDSFDELVKRLTSKGDVGTFLLGFVAAYLLEFKFALLAGLAPGTAGGLGASAAVGLKNTVEALWNRSEPATERGKALEKTAKAIRRIDLRKLDLSAGHLSILEELRAEVMADHQFWSAGLLTDDDFGTSIERFVGPYRGTLRQIAARDLSAKVGNR